MEDDTSSRDTYWECLPEVALANIFRFLPTTDKLNVGKVCHFWRSVMQRPDIWDIFYYSEDSILLTMDFDRGTQGILKQINDLHKDLVHCIRKFGHHFRYLHIYLKGVNSFVMFKSLAQECKNLHCVCIYYHLAAQATLEFKRSCYKLFLHNTKMQEVRVEDMNFKSHAKNEPIPINHQHSEALQRLWMVNSFRSNFLGNLLYLINLKELAINPHSLSFSLLNHLVEYSLRDLHLVANRKTREVYNETLSEWHWNEIRKKCPKLRVHCHMGVNHDWDEKETLLKPSMPLVSLIYRKVLWLKYENLSKHLAHYRNTLEVFIDYSLSEGTFQHHTHSPYDQRVDRYVIDIVKNCPKLTSLTVKQVMSSSALLVIAFLNRNWKHLYVREDMIEYTHDLRDVDIPAEAENLIRYNWPKEKFTKKVAELVDRGWKPMTKREYMTALGYRHSQFL